MRVLITGANRGIGLEMHAQMTARGDTVTGTTRGALPDESWLSLDVMDTTSFDQLGASVGDTPLDLLVCNAGVYLDKGETLDAGYSSQKWADTFAANVTGVFQTIQTLLPNVQAAGGKIAIISSQMGSSERAGGNGLIYRASKAAALNLGRNLAVALRDDGVAIGIYHPGWVRTDMGGSNADVSPEDSAAGLITRFDALSVDTTGCFEMYNGEAMPF
jgi:NAD(P)-dependent dehydrogenase (short-subunit alcohol dehydrogenase family)